MLKTILLMATVTILGGCSIFAHEAPGAYWCNEPFLKEDSRQFGDDELAAARQGYMYVTAAALALQGNENEDKDHWIGIPSRLKPIQPDPFLGTDGFQARAFLLYDKNHPAQIEALVIAYTGSQSNDIWEDWIKADFLKDQSQYNQARELLKDLSVKYPDVHKIIVTGFSLGGALAAHVALHKDTSSLVSEVWTFNPSGRIYDLRSKAEKKTMANSTLRDPRFWLVANYLEAVRYTRSLTAHYFFGSDWIPAPKSQFVNRVELYKTNPVQGHFRYILFRDLLWAGELDARINKLDENEPLEILRNTHFSSCRIK
jgi:dienelactone hydrolase